ncbi:hypothetical protein [Bacillus sp. WP8]|uniref:hypothetical protein n=1 Tax=Bacillus sp. WP8 TaxID=756828 RepID=UPI0011A1E4E6|nr:hypothetical protein [Bacillus sp. WP8]
MCSVSHRFRPCPFPVQRSRNLGSYAFLSEQQTPLIGWQTLFLNLNTSASFESLTFVLDFDGNDMMLAYSSLRL